MRKHVLAELAYIPRRELVIEVSDVFCLIPRTTGRNNVRVVDAAIDFGNRRVCADGRLCRRLCGELAFLFLFLFVTRDIR